ncbi:isopeptide-forming domain-containing fimbrial protein, partial [Enterococcus gilvus]|uniref:isopeptide-forming domain-containing fimbrial protein n=1 Tax=Enterococcus gilvus TaxID=160453 RepID=UPI003D6C6CBE
MKRVVFRYLSKVVLIITLLGSLISFGGRVHAKEIESDLPTGNYPEGSISKTVSNLSRMDGTNLVGDTVEYTIVLSNESPFSTWKQVELIDELPKEVDFNSNLGVTVNNQSTPYSLDENVTLSLSLGNLNGEDRTLQKEFVPKDVLVVKFQAIINQKALGQFFMNSAEARGTDLDGDPQNVTAQDGGIQVLDTQVEGVINVRYQDVTGNELAEPVVLTGKVGE